MPSTRVQIKFVDVANQQNVSMTTDGDVTVGDLIVIGIIRWRSGSSSAININDVTKIAGTATLAPFVINYQFAMGASHKTVIMSALVTGTGSLTLQLAAPNTGNWGKFALAEFTGKWTEARAYAYSSATGTSTTPATGNVSTPDSGVLIALMNNTASIAVTITEDPAFELITEEQDGTTTECCSFIDRIITSGGATDEGAWTVSNSFSWDACAVMFREGDVFPARMAA